MISQIYYLLRSRVDGSYLAARSQGEETDPDAPPAKGYLLVFTADYDALSYLNAHSPDLADKFGVESLVASQLQNVLQRWGFQGVGIVEEPRQPQVSFFERSREPGL